MAVPSEAKSAAPRGTMVSTIGTHGTAMGSSGHQIAKPILAADKAPSDDATGTSQCLRVSKAEPAAAARQISVGGSQIGHPKFGFICIGNQERPATAKAPKSNKTDRPIADGYCSRTNSPEKEPPFLMRKSKGAGLEMAISLVCRFATAC